MDLIAVNGLDYNGFPLNPRWAWQLTHKQPPDPKELCQNFNGPGSLGDVTHPCTFQLTSTNKPSGFNAAICSSTTKTDLDGHLNWWPATYQGKLHWSDHSPAVFSVRERRFGDDDYNWDLWPADGSGLTAGNPTIHLEFDSDETVDNIHEGWWDIFHHLVDIGNDAARQLIGETGGANPDAIIIGLMGLDAEHGGSSELHPVYGMAIHLKDAELLQCTHSQTLACRDDCGPIQDVGKQRYEQCYNACIQEKTQCPAVPPNEVDETWAILARNWGDEGECASDEKELVEVNALTFFIPRADASNVTVMDAHFFSNATDRPMSVIPAPGGALVTFDLGAPQQENLIAGLLWLRWTPSTSPRLVQVPVRGPVIGFGRAGPITQLNAEIRDEVGLNTLASRLSTAQRLQFLKLAMPARFETTNPVKLIQSSLPPKPTKSPRVIPVSDERRKQRNLMRAHILCEAYGGKIPGLPPDSCVGH